jgi:hypothetical protein
MRKKVPVPFFLFFSSNANVALDVDPGSLLENAIRSGREVTSDRRPVYPHELSVALHTLSSNPNAFDVTHVGLKDDRGGRVGRGQKVERAVVEEQEIGLFARSNAA